MEKVIMKKRSTLLIALFLFFGSSILNCDNVRFDEDEATHQFSCEETSDQVDMFGEFDDDEVELLEKLEVPKPKKMKLSDWFSYLKLSLFLLKRSIVNMFVASDKKQ